LLNTDVSPEKGFLEPLLVHFSDKKLFAVGCMDKSIENGQTILRGRGLGEWKKGFLVHRRGEVNKTSTLWVSGGSGAFRKSIWSTLGGFNELYAPFYWEDIDLSYRALKSGYQILFEPKSIVIHEHEKGAIKIKYPPFKIKTIAYRNQFIFVWENADLSNILSHIFWLPVYFIKALISFDRLFYLGFFEALILLPKIIKSKINYRRYFIKKDSEVIHLVNA
jgi:GT2 family glycosyltransferase